MTEQEQAQLWQSDYEQATGKNGKVTRVWGALGRYGGASIWVEVEEDGQTVYYSPYFNPTAFEGCVAETEAFEEGEYCTCDGCCIERDPEAWVDVMRGATDWGATDWGTPETSIPAY
ncbi:MAG: hypothetical protein PHQ43_10750 [Dehalococcoidales bacterium]|nr:hypothetical protein [Dehalococcoidales bacterium]